VLAPFFENLSSGTFVSIIKKQSVQRKELNITKHFISYELENIVSTVK